MKKRSMTDIEKRDRLEELRRRKNLRRYIRLAFHEAAHAVVGCLVGLELAEIKFMPEQGIGITIFAFKQSPDRSVRRETLAYLITLYAGYCSHKKILGDERYGSAEELIECARIDFQLIEETLKEIENKYTINVHLLEKIDHLALSIVLCLIESDTVWKIIQLVSREWLIRGLSISGETIGGFIASNEQRDLKETISLYVDWAAETQIEDFSEGVGS